MTRQMNNSFSKRGRGFRGRVSQNGSYNRMPLSKQPLLTRPGNIGSIPRFQSTPYENFDDGPMSHHSPYIEEDWSSPVPHMNRGRGIRPMRMISSGPGMRGAQKMSLLPPPMNSFRPRAPPSFPPRPPMPHFLPPERMGGPFGSRGRGTFRGVRGRGRGIIRGGRGKNLTWIRNDSQNKGQKSKLNAGGASGKRKPWATEEIINDSVKKRKLLFKARRSQKAEDWLAFKEIRSKLSAKVRDAKMAYYANHPDEAPSTSSDLNKPWITEDLKRGIWEKKRLLIEAKKTQNKDDWDAYTAFKGELTAKLRKAMQDYAAEHPDEDADKILSESNLQVASNDDDHTDSMVGSDGEEPMEEGGVVDYDHAPSLNPESQTHQFSAVADA